ncbi:hypothetical protein AWB80_02111 [Caballeronia pedi]|uniref:Uncharacterized protein n=1 Tax=Caballeronia pedi TaxID=1777141 RepID=A0A158ACS3_9BURK|nr:hypothetical protein [Caballeronia pedi]SAK55634.1 hypothetical protein AWB80_02111 [Caballeronia pedi]
MRSPKSKLFLFFFFFSFLRGGSAAEVTEAQMKIVTDTADRLCKTAPIEYSSSEYQLKAEGKAELSELFKKLADPKVSLGGSIKNAEGKRAVLEADLPKVIADKTQCSMMVFSTLIRIMFPPVTSNPADKATPNPGGAVTNISPPLQKTINFAEFGYPSRGASSSQIISYLGQRTHVWHQDENGTRFVSFKTTLNDEPAEVVMWMSPSDKLAGIKWTLRETWEKVVTPRYTDTKGGTPSSLCGERLAELLRYLVEQINVDPVPLIQNDFGNQDPWPLWGGRPAGCNNLQRMQCSANGNVIEKAASLQLARSSLKVVGTLRSGWMRKTWYTPNGDFSYEEEHQKRECVITAVAR